MDGNPFTPLINRLNRREITLEEFQEELFTETLKNPIYKKSYTPATTAQEPADISILRHDLERRIAEGEIPQEHVSAEREKLNKTIQQRHSVFYINNFKTKLENIGNKEFCLQMRDFFVDRNPKWADRLTQIAESF